MMRQPLVIVAANAWVADFISHLVPPGTVIPRFWESSDPLASLAGRAASAKLAITYGGFPFDASMIAALPALEFVQVVGAGYDGLDIAALERRGIGWTTIGSANSDDVADYAIAMVLALRRGLIPAHEWVSKGNWERMGRAPISRSFSAQRAGIIGLGAIGMRIGQRLAGFGIETRWWGPREKSEVDMLRTTDPVALAQWASVLFVCCPALPETDHLANGALFDALGPDGIYVSVARGSVTDESALIAALHAGRVGGAGLDVFETEPTPVMRWQGVPNVLLSPHHAGVTIESFQRTRDAVEATIRRFRSEPDGRGAAG